MKNDSTLKETSCDSHNKNDLKYMSKSDFPCVNFDSVKNNYCKNVLKINNGDAYLASFDALIELDRKYVMVEFKNGENFGLSEIRNKQNEGTFLFLEKTRKRLPFLKDNADFYVVITSNKMLKLKRNLKSNNNEWHLHIERSKAIFHKYKLLTKDDFKEVSKSLEEGNYSF